MKVKTLLIKNFKGISDLVIEPKEKIILAFGANGKGKTSFKEAFYAALTGNFPSNAIKLGESSCELGLVLEDGSEILRTHYADKKKPNTVKVNGKKTTNKAVNELLENRMGMPMSVFEIVSSAEKLEELDSAEMSTLMLTALSDKPDIDVLMKYIGTVDKEVKETIVSMFPEAPEKFDFSKITEVYNFAKDERASYKRNCVNFKAAVEYGEVEEPKRTIAEVEKDLFDIVKKEGIQQEGERSNRLYKAALESRQKVLDTIAKNEKTIKELNAKRPSKPEYDRIKSELNSKNEDVVAIRTTISSLTKNNTMFENTLTNLGKTVCPISEKLICTTDKTTIKADLEKLIEQNLDAIEQQNELLTKTTAEIQKLNTELDAYNENAKKYEQVIALTGNNERLKDTLPVLPPEPKAVRIFDYSLDKAKLNDELEHIRKYQDYLKNVQFLKANEDMVRVYDEIVNLLSPKGAVVKAITDHYLGVFSAAINETASKLRPGFEIAFDTEKGFALLVRTTFGGVMKSFSMLSSGEKSLTMFMMLNLLNMIHNQRILFIDDIDKLDNDALEQLLKILSDKAFLDNYDHIVLLGVDHEDTMKLLSGLKADRI